MAQAGEIYLGVAGSLQLITPIGRSYSVSNIELSRQERTASGKLVKDIIAVKKKITLDYGFISSEDLSFFLDMYDLQTELTITVYDAMYDGSDGTTTTTSPDTVNSYVVLMSPIDYSRVLVTNGGLWSGVKIILEEV